LTHLGKVALTVSTIKGLLLSNETGKPTVENPDLDASILFPISNRISDRSSAGYEMIKMASGEVCATARPVSVQHHDCKR